MILELTNLIIVRNSTSAELQGTPTLQRHKPSHIQFQMIRYEELELVCVLNRSADTLCGIKPSTYMACIPDL